ncbi:hypothetical protein [Streptomyces albireticuli]|uniref:Uncharacterized protein n=1 Tax=Streptomyces albireticuli TaxID=1940 RepID=A0A2A2DAQ4_9ACTN|nr:hypothetical protein [Streptomyces albireticuli]MCD9141083.1 hypothetical protein [Streptomyces albireticuli]MCD9160956.1 hypothetical protein [Streptomyces albireticuli]MCD9190987.1 hypothetical protein [Streptomyces albireticuli]PAU48561.1 hypothetical protein CK936_12530 [Streptomyces albireticuli]
MHGENPIRTTFVFHPPVDNALAWDLSLDRLERSIEQSFPDSSAKSEGDLGPRPAATLSFEIQIAEGVWIEGLATMPFEGMGSVMITGASAVEAAVFAAWLRDSFVPSPELVEFSSELAMNGGDESVWHLPESGSVTDIAEALQRHLEVADHL